MASRYFVCLRLKMIAILSMFKVARKSVIWRVEHGKRGIRQKE